MCACVRARVRVSRDSGVCRGGPACELGVCGFLRALELRAMGDRAAAPLRLLVSRCWACRDGLVSEPKSSLIWRIVSRGRCFRFPRLAFVWWRSTSGDELFGLLTETISGGSVVRFSPLFSRVWNCCCHFFRFDPCRMIQGSTIFGSMLRFLFFKLSE